jgi:tetratricopeptide (TPR) repeat protein
MKKAFVTEMMQTVVDNGFVWVREQGVEWFEGTLRDVMNKSTKACRNKELLSDFWTEIGDFYDIMEVPSQAVAAYKKAVKYDKGNSYPEEELEKLEEEVNDSFKLRKKGLARMESREFLAKSEAQNALTLIKNDDSKKALRLKASCYSVLGKHNKALMNWNTLTQKKGSIRLSQRDWFYVSSNLWDNAAFWRIQSKLITRTKGYFPSYNSLTDEHGDTLHANTRKKAICAFHIARLEFNYKSLMKLYKKYPEWKELREAMNELTAPGSSR